MHPFLSACHGQGWGSTLLFPPSAGRFPDEGRNAGQALPRSLQRRAIHLILAASLGALGGGAMAQDRLKADLLKQYGGVYSVACHSANAPQLRILADAITVEHAGKRVTGRKLRSAYSYFGHTAPADFRVGLMSEVRTGGKLDFVLFEDKRGPYITIEGNGKLRAVLGQDLLRARYRRCDGLSSARAARQPPVPAVPAQDEAASDAEKMLLDPGFRAVYLRALGPLTHERWLTKLDGPRPPTRRVRLDGTDFVLIAVCKPHDCADHNTALLYAADQGVLYGTVFQKGQSTLIGRPSPAIADALARLWRTEWQRR